MECSTMFWNFFVFEYGGEKTRKERKLHYTHTYTQGLLVPGTSETLYVLFLTSPAYHLHLKFVDDNGDLKGFSHWLLLI